MGFTKCRLWQVMPHFLPHADLQQCFSSILLFLAIAFFPVLADQPRAVDLSAPSYSKINSNSFSPTLKYSTSPQEGVLRHSQGNSGENTFTPIQTSKTTQNFVKTPQANATSIHSKTFKSLEQLNISKSIKAISSDPKDQAILNIHQQPIDRNDKEGSLQLTDSFGTEVAVSKLQPFSFNSNESSPNGDRQGNVVLQATPSSFIKEVDRETWRAFNSTIESTNVAQNGNSFAGNTASNQQNIGSGSNVQVKEVQHRNDFAAIYRRRILSGDAYANYFNWINDEEIEELHARIVNEQKEQKQNERFERTADWANMATANIAKNQSLYTQEVSKLSISSDPRQEKNLAIILGITSDTSANAQSELVENTASELASLLGINSDSNDLNNSPYDSKEFIIGYNSDPVNGLNTANTNQDIQNLSNSDLDINLSLYVTDTGELSQKSLLTNDNPFKSYSPIENNVSLKTNDSQGDLSKYLDQVLPTNKSTGNQNAATNLNLQDESSRVFNTDKPRVVEDSASQAGTLPFQVSSRLQDNFVIFDINIKGKSYIYQQSIGFMGHGGISFAQPQMPQATSHEDMQGPALVYFNKISLKVPIYTCSTGDTLTLNYQGCDEEGICYPPQRFSIAVPNSIKQNKDQSNFVSLINDSVHAINSTHEEGIAKLLGNNLLLGLLLCFVLGIGLDLTPCVLPMLPIFSTMLIGTHNNRIKVKDDVEIEADRATEEIQHQEQDKINAKEAKLSDSAKNKQSKLQYSKFKTDKNKTTMSLTRLLESDFKVVLLQNIGYAIGLSFTYMVLGLLFSSLGASLHNILQSPLVTIAVALLLCLCALSCAGVIEIKMPGAITNNLQERISHLKTSKFSGAILFGMLSALIASPCTSAPLAGALLYVFTTGNMIMGALYFLAIGLGMAFPLFIIGVFGSKFLNRSNVIGDLVKRILVIVLLITAYFMVNHLLGAFDLIFRTLLIYIVCVYAITSILTLLLKHNLSMSKVLIIAFLCLLPSYLSYSYFGTITMAKSYEFFTPVSSMYELKKNSVNKYTFVVFTADWCTNCRQMEEQVYSSDYFMLASNDLNKLVVDITNNKSPQVQEIVNQYQLVGVPCYMILDPAGNIIEQRLGVQSRETVVDSIHRIHYQKQYAL